MENNKQVFKELVFTLLNESQETRQRTHRDKKHGMQVTVKGNYYL